MSEWSPTDVRNFSKDIQKAFDDAWEYRRLKTILDNYPEFDALRKRMLDAAMENCYGIWGGGYYYIEAIKYVVELWNKGEKTEAAKINEKLMEENTKLKKEARTISAGTSRITSTLTSALNRIFSLRKDLGDEFRIKFEDWILTSAKFIEQEKDKEESN